MSFGFKILGSFLRRTDVGAGSILAAAFWACLVSCAWCDEAPDADAAGKALKQAWEHYKQRDFTRATKEFEALQKASPAGSKLYLQGLYGEASCWNYRQDDRDIEKARQEYELLLREAPPSSPLVPWTAFDLVRLQHTASAEVRPDYSVLADRYGDVYTRYPGTAASAEARLYQLNLQLLALKVDPVKILGDANEFIHSHPQSPYLSRFYGLVALCYGELHQPGQCVASLIQSLDVRELDPANPNVDNAPLYWRIAYEAQYEAGDFTLARTYYRRLLAEYPRDIRVFGVKKELSQMDEVEADLKAGRPLPAAWLPEKKP